jgi:Domain of unknown function (DUF5666)
MRRQMLVAVLAIILTGTAILGGVIPGNAQSANVVREGTINGVGGDGITVAVTGSGVTPVKISPATFVISRRRASLESIKPDDLLAVTSKREDNGTLTAILINIFPPEYRGRVREGQYPMDSGNVMTNATVMEYATRVENRTLYLKYKDGAAAIAVPTTAEVHRLTVIRASDLRAGMHVVARGAANPDGSISASSITVEQP